MMIAPFSGAFMRLNWGLWRGTDRGYTCPQKLIGNVLYPCFLEHIRNCFGTAYVKRHTLIERDVGSRNEATLKAIRTPMSVFGYKRPFTKIVSLRLAVVVANVDVPVTVTGPLIVRVGA
jgi:hypothetical protein